ERAEGEEIGLAYALRKRAERTARGVDGAVGKIDAEDIVAVLGEALQLVSGAAARHQHALTDRLGREPLLEPRRHAARVPWRHALAVARVPEVRVSAVGCQGEPAPQRP